MEHQKEHRQNGIQNLRKKEKSRQLSIHQKHEKDEYHVKIQIHQGGSC